ncbi:UDP-2,3-diacylglucosamine diphosphatase [Thalassotalea fusca]
MSAEVATPFTYFIADLHLTENRPDITACFLSFLENDAPAAEALYILGDLFEYWIGDDDDSVFLNDITDALRKLKNTGVDIFFIHGNRDFLLGEKYAKKSGMTLLAEEALIELYGQKIIIMHGDTLCTLDTDYQAFRRKSRTWWWQGIIKSLPLFIRRKIAQNYREKSAAATHLKPIEIMDVTPNEVIHCFEKYQTHLLIHGHTHRPAIHKISVEQKEAKRIVLGDWYEQGSILRVQPDNIELITKDFSNS